ncbi:MAG: hypothetical protein CMK59_12740 [Proteobacteria bacterium]|nr:hypothetical protein [Pseudomonadota bacterium]
MLLFFGLMACAKEEEVPTVSSEPVVIEGLGSAVPAIAATSESINDPKVPNSSAKDLAAKSALLTEDPELKEKLENIMSNINEPTLDAQSKEQKKEDLQITRSPNTLLMPDPDLREKASYPQKPNKDTTSITVDSNGYAETYYFHDRNSNLYSIISPDPQYKWSKMGGEHIIQASGWLGRVQWNRRAINQCIIEIQIPVKSLTVDPPDLREELGYTSPYDWQIDWIQSNMWSEGQLFAEQHHVITFTATDCTLLKVFPATPKRKKHKKVQIRGDLFIKGVSQRVKTEMIVEDEKLLNMSGQLYFNHTDFDIIPYFNPIFGAANKDLISVQIILKSDESYGLE